MKLAISNIAWDKKEDEVVYKILRKHGYSGVEIAPTRLFPEKPYSELTEGKMFAAQLFKEYHLTIPSLQSIWYGRTERLFGTAEEQKALLDYTKEAICFAQALGAHNLVFGSPKNRVLPEGKSVNDSIGFFQAIGSFAVEHNTCVAIEANPAIYSTNFINTTNEAFELVNAVGSQGIKVNVDFGTIIENKETLYAVSDNIDLVSHVHISEPFLAIVQEREQHKALSALLKEKKYQGYISVEMKSVKNIAELEKTIIYVKEVFI